jgi:hypothetical protein
MKKISSNEQEVVKEAAEEEFLPFKVSDFSVGSGVYATISENRRTIAGIELYNLLASADDLENGKLLSPPWQIEFFSGDSHTPLAKVNSTKWPGKRPVIKMVADILKGKKIEAEAAQETDAVPLPPENVTGGQPAIEEPQQSGATAQPPTRECRNPLLGEKVLGEESEPGDGDTVAEAKTKEKWAQAASEKMAEKGTKGSLTKIAKSKGGYDEKAGKIKKSWLDKAAKGDFGPKIQKKANFAKNINKESKDETGGGHCGRCGKASPLTPVNAADGTTLGFFCPRCHMAVQRMVDKVSDWHGAYKGKASPRHTPHFNAWEDVEDYITKHEKEIPITTESREAKMKKVAALTEAQVKRISGYLTQESKEFLKALPVDVRANAVRQLLTFEARCRTKLKLDEAKTAEKLNAAVLKAAGNAEGKSEEKDKLPKVSFKMSKTGKPGTAEGTEEVKAVKEAKEAPEVKKIVEFKTAFGNIVKEAKAKSTIKEGVKVCDICSGVLRESGRHSLASTVRLASEVAKGYITNEISRDALPETIKEMADHTGFSTAAIAKLIKESAMTQLKALRAKVTAADAKDFMLEARRLLAGAAKVEKVFTESAKTDETPTVITETAQPAITETTEATDAAPAIEETVGLDKKLLKETAAVEATQKFLESMERIDYLKTLEVPE